MLLLFFLIAGLWIGQLRGGGLSGLVRMGMRAPWLVVLPFFIELSFRFLNTALLNQIPYSLPILQGLRFAPLLLFVLLNIRNWRIVLVGLGVLMNFVVIMANRGRMPISELALLEPRLSDQVLRVQQGLVPEYVLMHAPASAPFWFLSDIIILPLPALGFASIGDVVLGLGLMLAVQHGMARYSYGRHVKGSLAPKELTARKDAVLQADTEVSSITEQGEYVSGNTQEDCGNMDQGLREDRSPQPAVEPLRSERSAEPAYGQGSPGGPSAGDPVRLSPRLSEIAAMIPRWASVADVGCDHGKLAVHLAERGTPLVIATDISAKSLAKAKALVRDRHLTQVKTRVSDGLMKLKPGEVDCIVISGLGGPTICEILDNSPAVIGSINRLVLQPQNAVGAVRAWILNNGFHVDRETIAAEDGRLYQILSAVPGVDGTRIDTLFDQEIGAVLIRDRHPLLPQLLRERVDTIDTILGELAGAGSPKAQGRRIELQVLRARCLEVLSWFAR